MNRALDFRSTFSVSTQSGTYLLMLLLLHLVAFKAALHHLPNSVHRSLYSISDKGSCERNHLDVSTLHLYG
ncbi:hypothetical protein GGR57DRAFT_462773 [Xylariaceae sp. FL1272]|nr:hypothetical protein GGR57DRAFT_462773 [Xylariaceae sp. FL1272]